MKIFRGQYLTIIELEVEPFCSRVNPQQIDDEKIIFLVKPLRGKAEVKRQRAEGDCQLHDTLVQNEFP